MNNYTQKGLKPLIIRVVAVAMSICYVFGPSHNEVNKLLHLITHQVEMPNTILAHSGSNDSEHDDVHHFEKIKDDIHSHKILGFLDKILEASNTEGDSENSEIVSQKIDKHIRTKKNLKIQDPFLFLQFQQEFLFVDQKIHNVFTKKIIEPPQLF